MSAHIVSTTRPAPTYPKGVFALPFGWSASWRPAHYPFAVLELPDRALPVAGDVVDTRPVVKIQLSHPDVAEELVEALNATDCLAARIAADTIEVLVPWLGSAADARQAATELRFFVRVWGMAHPDVRATVFEVF